MKKESTSHSNADADFLLGGGEMGARMRARDWSKTSLGPADQWPQSLKTAVRIMLTSRQPMFVWWGDELINLYNDAYKTIVGGKHPEALGQPAFHVWREIWDQVSPRAETAMHKNEGTYDESLMLIMERNGYPEETYYTFSYSPIPGDHGHPGGIICANTDDTQRIVGERQLALLRELAARTADARSFEEACLLSARALETNLYDFPFAMIYVADTDKNLVALAGSSGIEPGHKAAQEIFSLNDHTVWPFAEVIKAREPRLISQTKSLTESLPTGAWKRAPHQAIVVPITHSGQSGKASILVAGLNPYRLFDDNYRGFVDLVASQIAASISNAQAYAEERKRAEVLAELDRAKTVFFSNVSHEFRTPLTLMLGPLDDILAKPEEGVLPENRELLTIVQRNGQRLLKLVNTLLDFSRIESGRIQAVYEPVDLCDYTAELASVFRAAVERAGMRLEVDCPTLPEPVYVDREMWEKIVLNLVSNAFKYTLEGEIRVSLRAENGSALLCVQDTGIGIPEAELPNLFNRFHRVQGAKGRSMEGTGIGLALVAELTKLHGGSVEVESVEGKGSAFTIAVPLGKNHLPARQTGAARTRVSANIGASQFVEEAIRWLPDSTGEDGELSHADLEQSTSVARSTDSESKPRIVLADDNADMRSYVQRLLSTDYEVIAVTDGVEALKAVTEHKPDLVLLDIMMPNLDGFGVLDAIRQNPATAAIPVVMLSARAGEEARVEGLDAGADEYMVKPFSARELLSRVSGILTLARVRREASHALKESEERFRALAENAPAAIFIKDLEGRYTLANPLARKVLGRADGVVGLTDHDLLPAEIADQLRRNDLEVLATGRAIEREEVVQRDGSSHDFLSVKFPLFDSQGQSAGVCGVAIDITRRKQAERALRESELRFRMLADNIAQFAWIADQTGWIFWYNKRWFDYTGTTLDEMQGWGWRAVHHPDHVDRVVKKIQRSWDTGEIWEDTFPLRGKDGNYKWFLSRALPIRDEQGRILYWFGTNTDITEQRDADRRKDEFLATLAHELRNPLAPLRNGLQVMRRAKDDPEAVEQARTIMERQLEQMVRLIDDLLDLSRISRGKIELRKEQTDLGTIINNAIESSQPVIEQSGIELIIKIPSDPLFVDADVTRLAQVVTNLLNNAAKYTPRGGHVWLNVERHANQGLIRVKDDGIGIPADMIDKAFEMFTQIDRSPEKSQSGLGIGLNIARQLVEMHGGVIEAHSRGAGLGSEFVVRLPILDSLTQKSPSVGSQPMQQSASAPCRILVADDNEDSVASMAILLEMLGNEVRIASNGVEAVEIASAYRPDMILLDIGMPILNGYDACRRIREQGWSRDTVIVALTGWGQDEDKRKSEEAGFDHHLVKPVEFETIERLLAGLNAKTL